MIQTSYIQACLKILICGFFTAIYAPPKNIYTTPSWHPLTNLTMLDAITCTLSVSEHKAWQRQNKNLAWYVINSELSTSDTLKALEYLNQKEVDFSNTDSQHNNILHLAAQHKHDLYINLVSLSPVQYPNIYLTITMLIKEKNSQNKTASEVYLRLNNSIATLLSYSDSVGASDSSTAAACAQASESLPVLKSPKQSLSRVAKIRKIVSDSPSYHTSENTNTRIITPVLSPVNSSENSTARPTEDRGIITVVNSSVTSNNSSGSNSSASNSTTPPIKPRHKKVQFSITTFPAIQSASSAASTSSPMPTYNTSTHAALLDEASFDETSFHSDDGK